MDKTKKGMNCAECRRSKLKCDRQIPCGSCVRRGCAKVCPDGVQQPSKGQKLIDTQEKNARLEARIRFLESTIRRLQPAAGTLPADFDEIGTDTPSSSNRFLDSSERTTGSDSGESGEDDGLDAFGQLSVFDEGASTFHGRYAHTEYLMEPSQSTRPDFSSRLPSDILQLADTFPYGPRRPPPPSVKQTLISYIPTPAVTWSMYETFKTGTAWLVEPVPRREFLDEIYSHVHPGSGTSQVIQIHPHRLAVLFMICATACICDNTKDSPIPEYEEYLALAKAAMALKSLAEEPTIMAVQAVFIMSFSNYLWDRNSAEKRWSLMGLVFKMVSSIGLHRESSRWNLPAAEVQRRRWIFWETVAYDAWMSFVVGRPPYFSLPHIDCKYPDDPEALVNSIGKQEQSYHTWKHRFIHHCNLPAAELVGTSRSSYQEILKIDRTIRKCPLSNNLIIPGLNSDSPDPAWTNSLRVALQRFGVLIQRESMLLLIHRAHFAQALTHAATHGDLFHTPYTPSVLAVYRSSCLLIAGLRDIVRDHPDFVKRQWYLWTGPFTAGIVLAGLVIRIPGCNLSQAALPTLNALVELFETSPPLYGPPNALATLKSLQTEAQRHHDRIKGTPGAVWNQEELGLELPLLDGRTKLISRRRATPPSSETSGSSAGSPHIPHIQANGTSATAFGSAFGDVHPSVLAYFKALDGASPPSGSQSDESSHESPQPGSVASGDVNMDVWPQSSWLSGNQDVYNAPQQMTAVPPIFTPGTAVVEGGLFPMDFSGYGSLASADDGMGWTSFMDQLGIQNTLQNNYLGLQLQPLQQPLARGGGDLRNGGSQLPVY